MTADCWMPIVSCASGTVATFVSALATVTSGGADCASAAGARQIAPSARMENRSLDFIFMGLLVVGFAFSCHLSPVTRHDKGPSAEDRTGGPSRRGGRRRWQRMIKNCRPGRGTSARALIRFWGWPESAEIEKRKRSRAVHASDSITAQANPSGCRSLSFMGGEKRTGSSSRACSGPLRRVKHGGHSFVNAQTKMCPQHGILFFDHPFESCTDVIQ